MEPGRPVRRCRVVEELLGEPGVLVVYGEAGAGKTTLALYAVKLYCGGSRGACYYVSSEGLGFLERAEVMGVSLASLVVTEVFDLLDLVEAIIPARIYDYSLLVVDSVNYPYRRMVGERGAYTLFSYILAYIYSLSERYGLPSILTAQVHAGESGVLEPVGRGALWMWSNRVIRLEKRGPSRGLVLEKPGGLEAVFELSREGLVWTECPGGGGLFSGR